MCSYTFQLNHSHTLNVFRLRLSLCTLVHSYTTDTHSGHLQCLMTRKRLNYTCNYTFQLKYPHTLNVFRLRLTFLCMLHTTYT